MPLEIYEFGDVTVDTRRVEVGRGGQAVPLEPKAFDVLRQLLENRDRLVTKEELLEVVWKDTFVTPNVLTRAVAQLRKALGDDAFEARYIETVARRGYRFIAPVRVREAGGPGVGAGESAARVPEPAPAAAPRRSRQAWLVLAAAGFIVVGALAATKAWRASRVSPDAPAGEALLTPRRLTVAGDAYLSPAISLDGSAVAYVSDRTGSAEIHVVGLAPGSRERAITSDGGGNVEPEFSPDGQWLAFGSGKRGGIWVVPATGGLPRRVAGFGSWPSWSPDSRTLVFSSRTEGLSSEGVLWTVRRDGTSLVQLTQKGSPAGGHTAPSWSHDGRLVVFLVGRHEERELWLVEASGGAPRRLAAITRFSEPAFSPDDRAVYWIGTTGERNDCLVRQKLTAEGVADGEPERLLTFQGEGVNSLSVARNGMATYVLSRLSVNLFALDLDASGNAAGLPRPLTTDEDALNRYPDFGPDGSLAWEQVVAGRPVTAWRMDEDGGDREPLSEGLAVAARTPQWGADAKRVFTLVEPGRGEPPYFAWIDVATRQLTRIPLPTSGASNLPKLSPDGGRLAYHLVAPDGVNVWVRPVDGGEPRQVTSDKEAASYPSWSPDGEWLAVNLKRGEDSQVGVVAAKGGPVVQLTEGRGTRWPWSFSPDGERIAFAGGPQGEGPWCLYTVSRRTREVKQLTRPALGGARFPAFSPRGDRIVFSRPERRASLWTLRLP